MFSSMLWLQVSVIVLFLACEQGRSALPAICHASDGRHSMCSWIIRGWCFQWCLEHCQLWFELIGSCCHAGKIPYPSLSTFMTSNLLSGLYPGKLQSQADRKEENHLYKTSGCWIRYSQLCGGIFGQVPPRSPGGSVGNIRDRWRTRLGGVHAWHVHSLGQLYCKPNVTQWTGTLMTRDCFFREPSLEPSRP